MPRAILILAGLALCQGAADEAKQAHLYAERVLVPKFISVMNDWTSQHPQDAPGKEGEHANRLSRGDHARWQAVKKTWRDLDEAMKRAGY